jgi:CTP:molybdopterin cytidylyltransferase MocA
VSVAAVILAAGASRRLGRAKQNLILAGETLLQRTIRVAREASLSPVIVVSRANADCANTSGSGGPIIMAINPEPDEGLASSIRCGIAVASSHGVAGAVILACDQPTLRVAHLRALVDDESRTTGSAYAGSIGVPAYFPVASFPLLLQLRGDVGARKLLINAHSVSAEDLTLDIDTAQDFTAARALLERESVQS